MSSRTRRGLASGLVNTSFIMGGALGLATLASVTASRRKVLLAAGDDQLTALTRPRPRTPLR